MKRINIAHSLIDSYPPNINKFPKFYQASEKVIVLEPGDMLYIPPYWCHWVHSYPSDGENIAVSFPVVEFNEPIYDQFAFKEPFVYSLDKKDYSFLNLSKEEILQNTDNSKSHKALVSENSILVPVRKNSPVPWKSLKIKDLFSLKDKFVSFGQNSTLTKIKPPEFILKSFPNSVFCSFLWLYLYPRDTFIDSGLHYDHNPNVLIQIKGKKVIRLYHPREHKNLYISPLEMI